MDYAKYGDLENFQKKIIPNKNISETLLAFFALQILEGLQYCHQNKVVHMDIKQQNILIYDDLNIKITDFSVSQSYDHLQSGDKFQLPLFGTVLYMSPEVLCLMKIDVDELNKIDIFSLGVILYNLAFKSFPYEWEVPDRKNFIFILKKLLKNELSIPNDSNYSNLFKNFIKGLLDKDIKCRLSICQALNDPWISAARLILKGREKIYDLDKFLINMLANNIQPFNDYIKNYRLDHSTSD